MSTAAELQGRAAAVLPGGATHIARSYRPPLYVVRAQGARKWLVDGRELVDYTMGHGALLLGHAHAGITRAVAEQAALGTHFAAGHEREIEWAERIAALVPSVERVRFTSSGTEATMLALRLARAATGRDAVAMLRHHFHGWYDAVSADLDASAMHHSAAGVPGAVLAQTRVIDPADADGLERALGDHQVAALILEASGAHYGRDPLPEGYVAAARRLCDRTGTLLVIDEVVTGFRVHPGGMQALLGVRPDLSTFGKVMAGGLPGGAVGGRADILELLAPGSDGRAPVPHPGTFNANPLSAAAGCAMLALVADGAAQEQAATTAMELERRVAARLAATGVGGRVWRLSSMVHLTLDDALGEKRLDTLLRARGVDFFHSSAFVSTAHGEAELELTEDAFDSALRDAVTGG